MAKPTIDSKLLLSTVHHVFLPPKLPQKSPNEERDRQINYCLLHLVLDAINAYRKKSPDNSLHWSRMARMLSRTAENLDLVQHQLERDMKNMEGEDVLALHIRQQNAVVVIRKSTAAMTFEVFEAQPPNTDIMSNPGRLVRHFPGPAIRVPNSTVEDLGFIEEIANFLSRMHIDVLEDAQAKTVEAGSEVTEVQDSADPHYISQLFTAILRGFGEEVQPHRVVKRVADEVLWDNAPVPWRRSPLWLLVRVALQTSLDSTDTYKAFMVYLHASLLLVCSNEANQSTFSSDLLFAMRVKMARRLHKLGDRALSIVVQAAKEASDQTERVLQARWTAIQHQTPHFGAPRINLEEAMAHILPNSRDYVDHILKNRSLVPKLTAFQPNQHPRIDGDFSAFANGALTTAFGYDEHVALYDFEHAVHHRLSDWIDRQIQNEIYSASGVIFDCLGQYIAAAQGCYSLDVADKSIMILTIMVLWVALDRLVCSEHDLLLDYSPDIPDNLVETLLLRSAIHLGQATMVQSYIRSRKTASSRGSVFEDKATANCLAVRFYMGSPKLQALKQTIEEVAQEQHDEKIAELSRLNEEHDRLQAQISNSSCEFLEDRLGVPRHSNWCSRCEKVRTVNNLYIDVHEWPLPRDEREAQAVVFELECPESLSLWRSTTYRILCDLASPRRRNQVKSAYILSEYQGLASWSKRLGAGGSRITVASTTKSFTRTRHSHTTIPSTVDMVCVNSGLTFRLFDTAHRAWAAAPSTNTSFAKYTTFTLPPDSTYRYLQYSLEGTSHSSNQVLANQADCPKDLSLHEHYAFGTLRSGPRLQWMNIVRGLEENILTFSRPEVDLLHTQAAWQIGVLSDDGVTRDWHLELETPEYGRLFVSQAHRTLERVRANWLETNCVRTIVMLTARLLASTCDPVTQRSAYDILREARGVTLHWLGELSAKLLGAESESQIVDYQRRVCEMAAVCRSTYDVDESHLLELLSKPNDFFALISSSIMLHDNQPPTPDAALQVLLFRDRRLSHKTLPIILGMVRDKPRLLDAPVSDYWSGYRPGSSAWTELPAPNSQWIVTNTADSSEGRSQQVHLNLLEGRLLVDGWPLGRLPQNYVMHTTYCRLFGQRVLEVVPANAPGMMFTTRTRIEGNEISFCLEETGELIIQTCRHGIVYELIPHSKLVEDLPVFFSSDYHHWINRTTGKIEFRPLATPWSPSEDNWQLHYSSSSSSFMTQSSGRVETLLLDIHSSTFKQIAHQIEPLESPRYLHVTGSASDHTGISVDLPRMKLSFFVNSDGQLESGNFRGHLIDEHQSVGTLFGLRNQLILRAKDQYAQSLPHSRSVLIPFGDISFKTENGHSAVAIDRGSDRQVQFMQYKVDNGLGYLVGSGASLKSRLFKIYLHALTSYCLPDPLTGRTGTEEALYELGESATSSFLEITENEAKLLKLIGGLTATRIYHPANLKAMQTTTWSPLSSLAQHYAFCTAVNLIVDRARALRLFSSLDFDLDQYITQFDETLLERAANRTHIFYPADATGQLPTVLDRSYADHLYEGRDHKASGWDDQAQFASWTSRLVGTRREGPIYMSSPLISQLKSWSTVSGLSSTLELRYSTDWLYLDLPTSWITIYNLCRLARNRYSIATCLAAAAYKGKLPEELVPILAAFATSPNFQREDPPNHALYQLSDMYRPTEQRVKNLIRDACNHIDSKPVSNTARNPNELAGDWDRGWQRKHDTQIELLEVSLTQTWMEAWPEIPQMPTGEHPSWFDKMTCLKQVQAYFASCSRNLDLQAHLQRLERILNSGPTTSLSKPSSTAAALPKPQIKLQSNVRTSCALSLGQLMAIRACPEMKDMPLEQPILQSVQESTTDTTRLEKLLAEFRTALGPSFRRSYADDLESSRVDLGRANQLILPDSLPNLPHLEERRGRYATYLLKSLGLLMQSLGPITPSNLIVSTAGIWPRLTPRVLLSQLALRTRRWIPTNWIHTLGVYARAFIEYQRSQRLFGFALENKKQEFFKELDLVNGILGPPVNDPDWLLVQIDGNFSTRNIQTQVAREMISPSSGGNTVLQLNMGEGKSSVIVPIVAASLANETQLVRVVVLKPLWRQMFHLLVARLSGLANRRIWYLPFGRQIQVGEAQAVQVQQMYEACMSEGGILLVQPEHILSFKLMGIDRLLSSSVPEDNATSDQLRATQGWLSKHSRDILDESDEILHVRYQLVYTVGDHQPLEGHPDRWTVTQQVLLQVGKHIERLKQTDGDKVEYTARSEGQFPLIRILPGSEKTVAKLVEGVARDAVDGRISSLNLTLLPTTTRDRALRFLVDRDFPIQEASFIRDLDPLMQQGLLLLRGLLACGIVVFALRDKYYRVDYGLHLSRSLLAVPYRAKDIPSLRAEFGHPDVAVTLTCLSYYNHGLTPSQLETCFEMLFKLDNPALEYEHWVRCNDTAHEDFHQMSGINLKDREQFTSRLVPMFGRNSAVVNFFLSSVVFPKEAKQFSHKLSASGWDLAELKSNVTTGFSGTKDNSYLLPASIEQRDPVKQSSTNAMVLTYLLRPENNHYLCARGASGGMCSAKEFLSLLVDQGPDIRVLLDVGAQMLELTNEELVQYWLELRPDMAAAVYFNELDEMVILPRHGSPLGFYSSPFSQQLDKCIIYLDDGHTRGTDLKLPPETRAAVTLGPKMTKDRLLQGCMRLRKLGHGQSVMFYAPPEIDAQIRHAGGLASNERINALDIVRWAMLETCKDLERHVSHWAQQGVEYLRRAAAQEHFADIADVEPLKRGWMTAESRSLEEMYAVSDSTKASEGFTQVAFKDVRLKARLDVLGVKNLNDPSMDEEQEREVSHEVERQQQIERPSKSQPAIHSIHQDIKRFVRTGSIPVDSPGTVPLFHALHSSGLSQPGLWSPNLLASVDFYKPLRMSQATQLSEYMRPVHWILSGPDDVLIVVSPYEANQLLPEIRGSQLVRLNVFTPRVIQSMCSFSALQYYATPNLRPPPSLNIRLQLGLFAGQLYFDDHVEYLAMRAFLGLYIDGPANFDIDDVQVQSDGFFRVEDRRRLVSCYPEYHNCNFPISPISELKNLIGYRRKGAEYFRTHVGQLLHARRLTRDSF